MFKQRLLQQHELRLHFHVEFARGLKQRDEEVPERDLFQWLLENRFADAADHVLELGDLRFFRNPAAFEVQPRDFAIVLIEEREQIARQVVLVLVGQRADDRAVDRDVARALRIGDVDEDVPRVHVGVEEVVDEYLREERLHSALREQLHVGAACA